MLHLLQIKGCFILKYFNFRFAVNGIGCAENVLQNDDGQCTNDRLKLVEIARRKLQEPFQCILDHVVHRKLWTLITI